MQNGVIFKGDIVITPFQVREEPKRSNNYVNRPVKIASYGLLTRNLVTDRYRKPYYPFPYKEIGKYVGKCHVCNRYQQKQQKEPTILHPVPLRPWQLIAADLFQFQDKEYLVTTYYKSNFLRLINWIPKHPKK